MSRIADRNLLWGVLALQVEFITRDALIDGMTAWAADKGRDLEDILVERGALAPGHRDALAPLLAFHVGRHGDDPAKSLAALSSIGSVREAVGRVDDPDVRASLGHVGADAFATRYEPDRSTFDRPDAPPAVRFRRLRPHAKGNLGEVFVARDVELNRDVALKEIRESHADREDSRRRFLVEAEVTGGLEHPGIVPVYGLGRYPDGRPFYAMRFIKGDSLAEAIAAYHEAGPTTADPGERSVSLRTLLRRFTDVCNAVAYAHARGVLHRDLKPGNIMVGKYGETLVVDWGLARTSDDASPEARLDADEPALSPISGSGLPGTVAGTAVGTPAYMPPEQAEGRLDLLGPRSDVYSLGATLYHLLTGHAPFERGDLAEILRRISLGEFPPPRSIASGVPKGLEAICLKAMATEPEGRYPTALALAADLDHWLADEPIVALRDPWHLRVLRWGRHHPLSALLACAGVLDIILLSSVPISLAYFGSPAKFMGDSSMYLTGVITIGAIIGLGFLGGTQAGMLAGLAIGAVIGRFHKVARGGAWAGLRYGAFLGFALSAAATVSYLGIISGSRALSSVAGRTIEGKLHGELAALLVDCPDPRFNDPARAVDLARRAVAAIDYVPDHVHTLGIASYRAGLWAEALAAFDRAGDVSREKDSFYAEALVYRAMARFQIGEHEEASRLLTRSDAWIGENRPRLAPYRKEWFDRERSRGIRESPYRDVEAEKAFLRIVARYDRVRRLRKEAETLTRPKSAVGITSP